MHPVSTSSSITACVAVLALEADRPAGLRSLGGGLWVEPRIRSIHPAGELEVAPTLSSGAAGSWGIETLRPKRSGKDEVEGRSGGVFSDIVPPAGTKPDPPLPLKVEARWPTAGWLRSEEDGGSWLGDEGKERRPAEAAQPAGEAGREPPPAANGFSWGDPGIRGPPPDSGAPSPPEPRCGSVPRLNLDLDRVRMRKNRLPPPPPLGVSPPPLRALPRRPRAPTRSGLLPRCPEVASDSGRATACSSAEAATALSKCGAKAP